MTAPIATVNRAIDELELELVRKSEADIPAFSDLHKIDSDFFRSGNIGSFRDDMDDRLQQLFWDQEDNAHAMETMGYSR